MRYYNTPTLSFVGLCLFTITLIVNLCYRFSRTSDVGMGMLLSVGNALFSIYTLLWGLMGIIELRMLLRTHRKFKTRFKDGSIDESEYNNNHNRLKYSFTINIIYLVIFLSQLGYVIYRWDEEFNI